MPDRPIRALILAAGMGSRLGRPHPKALTRLVNGKSILEYQVDNLVRYVNFDDIAIIVGYKNEMIMEAFPTLTFVYNDSFDTTNTAKSLLRGLRKARGTDVIWMNGDVVFDHRVLACLLDSDSSCMAVNTAPVGEEEVKYRINGAGWISEVSKRVEHAVGEAVGINRVVREDIAPLMRCLEVCEDHDYFERGIEMAAANGVHFYPIDVSGLACTEIDFIADLDRANRQLTDVEEGA
jgi:choline kinase